MPSDSRILDTNASELMEKAFKTLCHALEAENLLSSVQVTQNLEQKEIVVKFVSLTEYWKSCKPTISESEGNSNVCHAVPSNSQNGVATSSVKRSFVMDPPKEVFSQRSCPKNYDPIKFNCWVKLEQFDFRATPQKKVPAISQDFESAIDQDTFLKRESVEDDDDDDHIKYTNDLSEEHESCFRKSAKPAIIKKEVSLICNSVSDDGQSEDARSTCESTVEDLSNGDEVSSFYSTAEGTRHASVVNGLGPSAVHGDGTNRQNLEKEPLVSVDPEPKIDQISTDVKKIKSRQKTFKNKRKKYDYSKRKHCEQCNYRCQDLMQLKRHVAYHHLKIRPTTLLYPKPPKQFKCDQCDYSGGNLRRLRTHVGTRHVVEKPYQCSFCSYKTANKEFLETHAKRHDPSILKSKPNIPTKHCESCDYTCSTNAVLKDHIASRHSTEKPFKCTQCPYKSAVKRLLTEHSKVHSDIKRYQCADCDYRSHKSTGLLQHRRSMHYTEKTQSCKYCSYKGKTPSALARHINHNHLRDVKLKPIQCHLCPFTNDNPRNMKEHALQHNEATHECKDCGGKYKSTGALKSHARAVHGNKSLIQCSHCDLKFKTRHGLVAHMKNVTGEFPYTCRICKANYVALSGFKKHFKNLHAGKTIYYCDPCDFGTDSKKELNVHSGGLLHNEKRKFSMQNPNSQAYALQ